MGSVHFLVLLATSFLVSVAERPRLPLAEHAAQDGVVAVAVGHRHQQLSMADRHDFLLLAKDGGTQMAGYSPTALSQISSLAPARHGRNVTEKTALQQSRSGAGALGGRRERGGVPDSTAASGSAAGQTATARREAALAISKGGSEAVLQAMGEIKALLEDADAEVRRQALKAIRKGGPEALLQAMGELKALLRDTDAKVRKDVAWAFFENEGGPEAVLQATAELKTLLLDADAEVRMIAAGAIQKGGPESVLQAMGELKVLLQDTDADIRLYAVTAVKEGGPEAVRQAVGELNILLQDADWSVRSRAAWAIGVGGSKAVRRAVGQLKVLLRDADAHVRANAVWAIGEGGTNAVLQAMGEVKTLLQDADVRVRSWAVYAIGQGGTKAVLQAMGEVKALLQDEAPDVQAGAARAIAEGGPAAVRQAVGELKALLYVNVTAAEVRAEAAQAIGKGGPAAVRQAMHELEKVMLEDNDNLARESAVASLRSAGADVIAHAVEHLRSSLTDRMTRGNSCKNICRQAAKAVKLLGPAAIEKALPELQGMLREYISVLRAYSSNTIEADISRNRSKFQKSVDEDTQSLAAAAEAINRYLMSRPNHMPVDVHYDLKLAKGTLKKFVRAYPVQGSSALDEVLQSAILAFDMVMEDRCMASFERQVGQSPLVKWWAVTTPKGHMVQMAANATPSGYGMQAHRCPNRGACPGEHFDVKYGKRFKTGASSGRASARPRANVTCPLERKNGAGAPCSEGYDSSVAGCAGCLERWGRSVTDAFTCQKCGATAWLQWAVWLAHPSLLLAISLRSAKSAATRSDAAAFANDVLKIALSFSSSAAVIISSLANSDAYRDLNERTKERLGKFSEATQSGEVTWSSSADCLLGRVVSLNELLLLSLANLALVLAAAALVLGIICIARRWQGLDSSFVEDLMTLGVVSGNQYLPGVAAACAIAVPCYHTQTEDATWNSLMAYSTSESCEKRVLHIAMRAPILVLIFTAGPALWAWLLHRHKGDERNQYFRFLTASYRPDHEGWEVNRLAKNIVLKCAVAVAPVSYCPGLQLFLVLSIMFSFTAWHLRNRPYRFDVLNRVEAISLWVLNLCMMASSLVVSGSWYLTRELARNLILAAYVSLAINAFGLASLCLWSKLSLNDNHQFLKT